jgi:hypothetical protein
MNRLSTMQQTTARSDFIDALRKGLLLGAAVLVVLLPPMMTARAPGPQAPAPVTHHSAPARPAPQLADFGSVRPTADVRLMANWVVASGDHKRMSFVIVDKKDARVYAFDPQGRLKSAAPALLGSAIGDDTAPGVGDKALDDVLPQEKTTAAGRFVAEVGMDTRGEDVVWVDYDGALSMHRVLQKPERLKALASPTNADNRMSFGCVNLPPAFYEQVLRPAVDRTGAVIYILPETRSLHEQFPSFHDVTAPVDVAQH